MGAVKWYFGTRAKYEALKAANSLYDEGMYFCTDTKEWYYHQVQYMANIIFYTGDLPANPVTTRIYFNTNTLTAYVHDGSQWITYVEPASVSVLGANGVDGVPIMVTGAAAKAYIDENINTNNNQALIDLSYEIVRDPVVLDTSTGFEAGVTDMSAYKVAQPTYVAASGKFKTGTNYFTDATGATPVDTTSFTEATDVSSYFVAGPTTYVAASGKYVAGTTYFTDNTGETQVDTTSFSEPTDVSSYFVAGEPTTTYVAASGTYVNGTNYFTDNTGETAVDTTGFEEGVTDVSTYFVAQETPTFVQATGTFVSGTNYFTDATGTTPVDTTSFSEGTDVSSYFVANDTFVPATGTFVTGTTYYTDNTGATTVDTTSFSEGTDVSSYFVEGPVTYVAATGTFDSSKTYYHDVPNEGAIRATKINFKRYGDQTHNDPNALVLNQFAASINRNAETGDINILASDGTTVLGTINIPLDNYTVSGVYDPVRKAIVLTMSNGQDTLIYAADIINLYNQLDTSTVDVTLSTVDGVNYIRMDVKLSQDAGNELESRQTVDGVSTEGLYINRVHLMDFLTPLDAGEIVVLDAEGNAVGSDTKIGGATLYSNENESAAQIAAKQAALSATEQAVTDMKTNEEQYLSDTYLHKDTVRSIYADFAQAYKVTVVA